MMSRRSPGGGQTLIEAMIAVSILTVGFLGIATLLSRSLFLSRVTSDELTASYLASEGIELAKNLIDHDVYASSWGATFGGGGDFQLDYATCTGGGACTPPLYTGAPLALDPSTNLYSYGGSMPTGFRRLIRVAVPSANEIRVNSIVTWSTGPITSQSVNLEDHFYNWHP